ncbi:MAG: hypothetical protein E7342_02025 [Clostridiales bacterium]|nr:hypothetical protein [Clostridiales bacterium]
MEFTKDELEKRSLHDLRLMGREIGVKSPTSLVKKELIEKIVLVSNGQVAPYRTKKGRPTIKEKEVFNTYKTQFEKKLDNILLKLKQEILKNL